jgi:hypothetical protein
MGRPDTCWASQSPSGMSKTAASLGRSFSVAPTASTFLAVGRRPTLPVSMTPYDPNPFPHCRSEDRHDVRMIPCEQVRGTAVAIVLAVSICALAIEWIQAPKL